ncbi:ABC transporter substrate-binding protein [Paraburkholderia sp.]|uniref:ABC transporter substrate-binding protein n=1 Tax=Paraburkholderia sp. TaxID=1926495 RepID=UPI0039E67595
MRKHIVPIMLAGVLAAAQAHAETTLYVGAFGGSFEQLLRQKIIPPFEKANDVKVVVVPGDSTTTMARLQAQKGKQSLDVAILDDGPMYQAIQLGFCDTLTDAPVYQNLFDVARFRSNKAVTFGLNATGLVYNERLFAAKGWAPPTSWHDLADPRYKGKVAFPTISNGYGLQTLIVLARLNGGGEKNIQPGFDVVKTSIAPNVLSFDPSPGKISELFQTDSIALAAWGDGRTQALRNQGVPVRFVAPKEGAVVLGLSMCPVKHDAPNDLAQKFIQFSLSPEIQALYADEEGVAPVNKLTRLTPTVAARVASPDAVAKMLKVDWNVVNDKRATWTQQWNRDIER